MKTFYHLCAFLLLLACNCAKGQNPYIADVTVLPINPTENDIIQVAVNIQTGNPAKRLSITPSVLNGDIYIHACYGIKSGAGQINIFKDTLTVGKLPDGIHKIVVKAYQGVDTNSCVNLFDSSTRTDTFDVLPLMPITQKILPTDVTEEDSVKIAVTVITPNPAKKISLAHSVLQNKITISGCFAKTQPSAITKLFTDTLTVGKLSEGEYQSVFTSYYSDGPDTNVCNAIIDSTQTAESFTVANGVAVRQYNPQKGKIYPNPTSGEVNIQLPEGVKLDHVMLEDMSGSLLKTFTKDKICVSEVVSGLYILRIKTDAGEYVHKLRKD